MKRTLFFLFLIIIGHVAFANTKTLFSGSLNFSVLERDVLYSQIFKNAPQTTGSIFSYQSTEVTSQMPYSHYEISIMNALSVSSHYQTIEYPVDAATPQVTGNGIGYGGIVSLAYEKSQTKKGKREKWSDFYKKFEIVQIENVSGNLFPLKVGNVLTFNYTAYVKTYTGLEEEKGQYTYRVIAKQQGYATPNEPVPGSVYVIQLLRSTNTQPLLPMNQYYFSTKLGWYVEADYYREGQIVVKYKLQEWS